MKSRLTGPLLVNTTVGASFTVDPHSLPVPRAAPGRLGTTLTPSRPNDTAGLTGRCPTPTWTRSFARLARRIASFPAEAVRSAKQVLNEMTLPAADAVRADARRFHQLVASDTAKSRTAALFAQGPQTRSPLELDLGDRIGSL